MKSNKKTAASYSVRKSMAKKALTLRILLGEASNENNSIDCNLLGSCHCFC